MSRKVEAVSEAELNALASRAEDLAYAICAVNSRLQARAAPGMANPLDVIRQLSCVAAAAAQCIGFVVLGAKLAEQRTELEARSKIGAA